MTRSRWLCALAGIVVAASLFATAQTADPLRQQARAALAQTSGEIRIAGLEQPVEVIRDRWGVPHIYARTVHDLFFAQGYVAAQDRLWQLDLWRRIEEGKLSELLGAAGLKRDTFARLLRYRGDWDEEWRGYGPRTREIARAFVAGVNAQIDSVLAQPDKLPLEFQMTGSRPEHWTPEVVVGRMAGYVMTRNARTEVQRARMVRAVGAAKAAELMPSNPPVGLAIANGLDLDDITDNILDVTTGTSESVDFAPLRTAAVSPPGLARLFGRPVTRLPVVSPELQGGTRSASGDFESIGSNDWVISGKRTATGKPLLANDPHRALMLPSLRYTVHLNAPGWNVIGAGEPALPGIAAGHNDRVAFGFTIVGMDQQDLYVEQLDPANADRYLYKGAWQAMRVERERVKVKGLPDREMELRFTRHGPVLHVDAARHRAYALHWVGSEPGSAGYLRSLMLDTARNLQDFRAAVAGWKIPSENIVYADVDGNIAWIAAGLAPIRKNWTGLLPVPGQNGEYEWDGFLKAEDLPQLTNPASGFIATANHNILPEGYYKALGYEFGAPYRFARIISVLQGCQSGASAQIAPCLAPTFTVADSEKLQHDETSIVATAVVEALTRALAARRLVTASGDATAQAGSALSERAGQAARMLTRWNGDLSQHSSEAALYEIWLPLLSRSLAPPAATGEGGQAATPSADRVLDLLRAAGLWVGEPFFDAWVDGTARTPSGKFAMARVCSTMADSAAQAVIDAMTGRSLEQAWDEAVRRMGSDATRWAWGDIHHASFEHPLAFTAERQAVMNLPAVPRGGDATTPNATGAGARQTAGASYREVIDLADWDRSTTVNVPGESGQPQSEFYANLLPLWARGEYHQLAFSRTAVERVAARTLRLVPAGQ
jgi:penicillin amidase